MVCFVDITPTPDNHVIPTLVQVTPSPDVQNITANNSAAENNDTNEDYDPEEELRIDYLFEDLLLSHLALENDTMLYKMGHKYKDFVFDCNFRGIDCR